MRNGPQHTDFNPPCLRSNYLTCARDEKPDSSNFDPLGALGSRVGYCTVTTLASWPLDESYDHWLGQFVSSLALQ